ncbi:MAG: cytochrome c3 family protein [Kofleriaceae bacterium]
MDARRHAARRARVPTAAWALIALVIAAGSARPAAAQPARGFDHDHHDRQVVVGGQASLPCTSCHPIGAALRLRGVPDHATCFGRCHGPAPTPRTPVVEAQRPVCATCHGAAELARRRPSVSYPPYTTEPDFGLRAAHATHASVACSACHATPGVRTTPRAPHARCGACHSAEAAASCVTCHPPGFGANLRPRLERGPLAVGAAFDHRRHLGRAPAAAALGCATCHATLAGSRDEALPTPAVTTCAGPGCHDGAAAFATTDRCTRCHTAAPADTFEVARPSERFSHERHAARTPLPACASCHHLDATGQAVIVDHRPCAGCHAADFAARTPTTCGACHLATEPWRPLVVDQAPAPRSEFGAQLSHRAHAAIPCAQCHRLATATRDLRPPRGHGACASAGCHAEAGGPAPQLVACTACHVAASEATHDRRRLDAPWSVRARFRHAPHQVDQAGAPLACVTCHVGLDQADTIEAIAGPAKPTCAPCHDGTTSFRMSGHGCARCHGR